MEKYNKAIEASDELDLEDESIHSYMGGETIDLAWENFMETLEEKEDEDYSVLPSEYSDIDDDDINEFNKRVEAALDKKIASARSEKIEEELSKYSKNVITGKYRHAAENNSEIDEKHLGDILKNTEDDEKDIQDYLSKLGKYYTIGKLSYDEDGKLFIEQEEIKDEENNKTIIKCDLSNILMIKYNKTVNIAGSARYGEVTVTSNDGKQSTRHYNDSFYAKNIGYSIDIESIPYQNMVRQYDMPFEFLFALLTTSSSPDWITKLTDLVMEDSRIDINVHDNYSETQQRTIKTWTQEIGKDGGNASGVIYRIITNDSTEGIHTLSTDIEKVKTWIYNKEILFEKKQQNNSDTDDGISESDKGNKTNIERNEYTRNDSYEYTKTVEVNNPDDDAQPLSKETKNSEGEWIDYNPFLRLWKNSTGEVEIKFQKDSSGNETPINDKFEKRGKKVKYKIIGGGKACTDDAIKDSSGLLFKMLGENQKTQNYETILRYLLYIYTGNEDYGATDVNDIIDIFNERNFNNVSGIYGSTLQEKVWFALKNLGYSDEAVAGAMGNIHHESKSFSPSAVEEGSGEGIGLCQWSYGRKDNLKKYAESKGVDWKDEDTQIEFLITEISGSGPANGYASYNFMAAHGYSANSWKNSTSIEDATKSFARTFERPTNDAYNKSINSRIEWAKKYYEQFHGKNMLSGGASLAESGDGYSQVYRSSTGRVFKEFKQYQGSYKNLIYAYGNGTISSSGCSITSIAVVLSGYGVNVTPADLRYHGRLAEHFTSHGVSCSGYEPANKDKIMNNLKSGKPMVVSIKGILKAGGTSKDYTEYGHYIALLDARGTDKVYVSDVGSNKSTGWAKVDDIIRIVNRGILYTK